MKDKVLVFLKGQDDFISGEEISQKLGVTRAAVWKAIKKLQGEGYEITSSTKKGYKLVVSPNIITTNEIKDHLNTEVMGQEVIYFDEMDSTNSEAKRLAREGAREGTLVVTDHQTKGKGRLGRTWSSPPKEGIWMSLVLRPKIVPSEAQQLTLIAGVNMCEAIKKVTNLEAQIKWPNDIVVSGKKVCGILTEMSAQVEQIEYVIVGVGVNVNIKEFPEELPYATSLAIEGGQEYSRKQIIRLFLERFEKDYQQYLLRPDFLFIKERYERNCITLHKKVKLMIRKHETIAEALEINETGALMVKMEDGTIQEISTGEVSVRGLFGYV